MKPAFDLPRERMVPAREIALRVLPRPHPFEPRNAPAIDRNWRGEQEKNPALYDGRIMLFSRLALSGGRVEGDCHEGRFASFLYWRGLADKEDLRHAFANAIMVTADGALLAVEMGAHTANAGLIYFPSGSFDPLDVVDGRLDVAGNLRREIREETGIDLAGLPREPGYHVLDLPRGAAIVTRVRLPWTADEVEEGVRRFVAAEADPEIARPVILRDRGSVDRYRVAAHVPTLVAWHHAFPLAPGELVSF